MRIGFIGGGNMAGAMIASLRQSGIAGDDLIVSDINAERLARLTNQYAVRTTDDNIIAAAQADTLVLAVKPQVLPAVCEVLQPDISNRHLVISIAAGIRLAMLETLLPDARMVRVMPNLPCQVGFGVSAFCRGHGATDADREHVCSILDTFGTSLELPEHAFDAVTALSGSGPAFIAWFAELMIQTGEDEGLDREAATALVLQTLRGTAELLIARHLEPTTLVEQVKSPGGTTAAGMQVLEASPIAGIIRDTIRAAAQRSRELSSS